MSRARALGAAALAWCITASAAAQQGETTEPSAPDVELDVAAEPIEPTDEDTAPDASDTAPEITAPEITAPEITAPVITEPSASSVPAPASVAPPMNVQVTAEQGRGITVSVGDVFSAAIRARIQIRNTLRVDGSNVDDLFEIRSARLWFSGNVVDRNTRYGLQLALGANDFEPNNPSPIYDAYLESTHLRDLNVRVGQFFVPFDRARTIREFALQTVDRTDVVRELTLDRDVGIVLQSTDLFGLAGVLSYQVGIFGGDGRNRLVTATTMPDVGFLYVARVSVRPFGGFDDDQEGDLGRSPRPRLAIGGAVAFNQQTDRTRSTTGAFYQGARFDYVHAAADLVFKWSGLSVLTEIVYREATQDSVTFANAMMMDVTEYSRNGWGYLAQASMMLHPMIEIWGRWEHLEPIRPIATDAIRSAHGVAGGLNVYLNGHFMKIQADWAHSFGNDFLVGSHVVRLQLDTSF